MVAAMGVAGGSDLPVFSAGRRYAVGRSRRSGRLWRRGKAGGPKRPIAFCAREPVTRRPEQELIPVAAVRFDMIGDRGGADVPMLAADPAGGSRRS
jgi:hypothetical protein